MISIILVVKENIAYKHVISKSSRNVSDCQIRDDDILCPSEILLPLSGTGWYSGLDFEMWPSSPELQMTKSARLWWWRWSWRWKWMFCGPSLGFAFLSLSTNSTCSLLLLLPLLLNSLALFILVWQRNEDLNIVEREESRLAVQHALVPVLVDLIG